VPLSRTLRRTGVAGALALAVVVPLAATAQAQVTVITDAKRDTPKRASSGDITKVRVNHGIGNVKVAMRTHGSDVQTLYVDTDTADPGPERVVTFSAEVPVPGVFVVDDFSEAGVLGSDDDYYVDQVCSLPRARTIRDKSGTQGYRFAVPRSCLGDPARVRVSLVTAQDFPGTAQDWAPGRQVFGPWTRSGPVR
jgi:hypothetical protein